MPWLTCQGSVEAFTHWGADASLLTQHLEGRLASSDSLWMAVRVLFVVFPSADESLRDICTFAFVASHLFSAGGHHSSAVFNILCLVERL